MPKFIRLQELADQLGVCEETIQGWVKSGRFLPARRLGSAWVWREDELSHYLQNLPHAVKAAVAQVAA